MSQLTDENKQLVKDLIKIFFVGVVMCVVIGAFVEPWLWVLVIVMVVGGVWLERKI